MEREFHQLVILTLGTKWGLEFRTPWLRELSVNLHSTKPHLTIIVMKWIYEEQVQLEWILAWNWWCIVMVPTIWSQWMGDGSQNWRYELEELKEMTSIHNSQRQVQCVILAWRSVIGPVWYTGTALGFITIGIRATCRWRFGNQISVRHLVTGKLGGLSVLFRVNTELELQCRKKEHL